MKDPILSEQNLNVELTAEKLNQDFTFDQYNSTTEGGLNTIINEETIDSIDVFERDFIDQEQGEIDR